MTSFLILGLVLGGTPDDDAIAALALAKAARERVVTVVATEAPHTGYPIRGRWWTGCNNWQHMTQGEHRGQFPADWLASLSWAELQSVHSDAHEGKVHWDAVPGRTAAVPVQSVQTAFAPSTCPGGNCPQSSTTSRWRLFR